MRRGLTRSLLPLAALALGLAVMPAASAAAHPLQTPIGPNQYFKGIFQGHPPGPAIIFVACPVGAATGHPIAGQQLWVVRIPTPVSTGPDVGFTGSQGTSINARLNITTSTAAIAHFTGYGVKVNLSTAITVPCSGKGAIDFAPAPTSKTAHTAVLAVTFGPPPRP